MLLSSSTRRAAPAHRKGVLHGLVRLDACAAAGSAGSCGLRPRTPCSPPRSFLRLRLRQLAAVPAGGRGAGRPATGTARRAPAAPRRSPLPPDRALRGAADLPGLLDRARQTRADTTPGPVRDLERSGCRVGRGTPAGPPAPRRPDLRRPADQRPGAPPRCCTSWRRPGRPPGSTAPPSPTTSTVRDEADAIRRRGGGPAARRRPLVAAGYLDRPEECARTFADGGALHRRHRPAGARRRDPLLAGPTT